MRKIIKFLILILVIFLMPCNKKSIYHEDKFFFENYLDENLVKDLPIPSGNILYKESYGFSSPTVYVKSSLKADEYAREVLDYLIQNNYKYIYAVEKIYVRYGLAPTKEKAYLVKEFSSLDDCYFEGEESWFFIFGNDKEVYVNENGTVFLKNPHSIRIHNENSLLEDKKIKFKYDYRIIIDNDPTYVMRIGN